MRVDRIILAAEMARKDLTVKRLTELSGLSRVTVSGVKSGKSCTAETASAIAKALGMDVLDIIQE